MINEGSAVDNREGSLRCAEQNKGNDQEGFGEFEFQNESLLSLVQPELLSLSQHWLAALRDHALLSLPPGLQLLFMFYLPMFVNQFCKIFANNLEFYISDLQI